MAPLRLKYALASFDPEAPAKPRPFKEWIDNRAHELDDAEAVFVRQKVIEDECRAIDRACDDERRARLRAEIEKSERERTTLARQRAAEDECAAIDRELERRRLVRERAAFTRRQAIENECAAIDRQCVKDLRGAAERNAEAIVSDAEDAAADARADADWDAKRIRHEAGKIGGRIETAASNLDHATKAARNGTHDELITREHVADETQFEVLCAHAPKGRPTRGFWFQFWSLNDSRTGAPLAFPEAVRAALERAFDAVAALARRMAALARHEATHEQQVRDWNAGHEKRERTLDEAREAEGRLTETQAAVTEAEDRLAEIEDRAARAKAEASEAARTARRERDEAREETGRLAGLLGPYRRAWDAICAHKHAVAEIEADRERPRSQDLEAAHAWLDDAQGRDPHTRRLFDISCHAANPEGWRWLGFDPAAFPGLTHEGLRRPAAAV